MDMEIILKDNLKKTLSELSKVLTNKSKYNEKLMNIILGQILMLNELLKED
ncbi:hypothetical protein [Clostridium botulinum]|uniref:hypothetical protein n=1 Tax=Clostridium botulinum TaxID=1491 RepID=UPI001C9B2BCE|nr:hypothetical protein [Clostridium botulinum]MBY6809042.1 hypothetical protein [Clostridium botulinum]MBY6822253.1 hypothetical protein [Clostridium botulinum]MBY6832957.1 hypothetical protein [Clostridium botulinum]MBY6972185.1 hypothetical protein [Clostridium botulinum]HBJ1652541.1 hypothetical protein [Clostridium botulinum]